MLKRILSLFAAAILALGCTALATEYTLDEKLKLQIENGSGLKAELKFSSEGGDLSVLDSTGNALLKALNGTLLSLQYLRGAGRQKGAEDTKLTLVKGDKQMASYTYRKDGLMESFATSLLQDKLYADVALGGTAAQLLSGQDAAWPSVENLILKLNMADATWQAAAKAKLDAFGAKLTLWLNGFSKTATGVNGAAVKTEIRIPAADFKAELKALLKDFFADKDLQTLLNEQFSPREAAAYLQPSLEEGLSAAIDALPLTGEITATRAFDLKGVLRENKFSLPFAGLRGMESLQYSFLAPEGEAEKTSVKIIMQKQDSSAQTGAQWTLDLSAQTEKTLTQYEGKLNFEPEIGAKEAKKPWGLEFSLWWKAEPEIQSEDKSASSRDFSAELRLTPKGEGAAKPQEISMKLKLDSPANSRAATRFAGQITWAEAEDDSKVTVEVNGSTTAPWAIPAVDLTTAVRLDKLEEKELTALAAEWKSALPLSLAALILSLSAP